MRCADAEEDEESDGQRCEQACRQGTIAAEAEENDGTHDLKSGDDGDEERAVAAVDKVPAADPGDGREERSADEGGEELGGGAAAGAAGRGALGGAVVDGERWG